MHAFIVALIFFGSFLVLGAVAKRLLDRRAVDLSDVHAQAGPNRRQRRVFLLGSWRKED